LTSKRAEAAQFLRLLDSLASGSSLELWSAESEVRPGQAAQSVTLAKMNREAYVNARIADALAKIRKGSNRTADHVLIADHKLD
jgi:hypothetical protein